MKIALSVLSALCLILAAIAGVMVFQARDNMRQQNAVIGGLTEIKDQLAAQKGQLEIALAELRAENGELKAKLAASEAKDAEKAVAAVEPAAGEAAGESPKPPNPGAAMKELGKMLENPAMKEMIKQQQVSVIDMIYGDLYTRFGLSEEEKKNFQDLLVHGQMAQVELGMKLMGGDLTPEETKALRDDLKKQESETEDLIKQFLNSDEDFATYQSWKDSANERMQLSMMKPTLEASGSAISAEQEDRLVSAMVQSRKDANFSHDYNKPGDLGSEAFTDEAIAAHLGKMEAQNEAVLDAARGILDESQFEAFQKSQQQMRAMTEMGLQMTKGMFSGGGAGGN